jgi:pimeloyl-ACP methyl ester carboxylesterase
MIRNSGPGAWAGRIASAVFTTGLGVLPALGQESGQQGPGTVYYLDGAGGGGSIINFGRGIRKGLERAGFEGEFSEFTWQTGLGILSDQALSEADKQDAGARLAREIKAGIDRRAEDPVHLIGLSAGTAILIHGLEALPDGYYVDTVVLLGSSMDADYDLTRALRHVRGRMHVFVSRHDPVLRTFVPMVGTADRRFALTGVAGLRGFRLPAGADRETRRLYSGITATAWRPEFALYDNFGGHTGATSSRFVSRFIAPLLAPAGGGMTRAPGLRSADSRPGSGERGGSTTAR